DVIETPYDFTIYGTVTLQGQIRIHFKPDGSQQAVTGIGTMQQVNHAWRMTMQMASTSSLHVVHWAYMTKLPTGAAPSLPIVQPPNDLGQGRWLLGTRWLLNDSSGTTGPFEIVGYRKGFFLGRGTGQSNYSVFGSVTPEGNLF